MEIIYSFSLYKTSLQSWRGIKTRFLAGLGATAPNLGNRRGMRDAHLAQPCRGGLKLRFARRPMAAQGLRPPPDGLGRLLRSMGKLGK
jgi:hypothetical protein